MHKKVGPDFTTYSLPIRSTKQKEVGLDFATHSLTIREKKETDEEKARQIFNDIMATCRALDRPFIDPDFAHNQKSLGNYQKKDDVWGGEMLKEQLIWLRPSEICTKDGNRGIWAVFRDPKSSDIEQGDTGDCWFVAAMALVAERPDILERVVLTKEYNPVGVYQIRLCLDNEWKIITIDDFFPCRPNSRVLAFATGRKNQLWVPLIEKALAKTRGSYEKLWEGEGTREGLAILTGAPCEIIDLRDENLCRDTVWARLLSMKEAGFVMGCATRGRRLDNHEEYRKKGLVPRHGYSILDVRQEGEHKLVRLHNPWGRFAWNGDWSDNWRGWPAGLRTLLLKPHDRGNGTFWMSFADFLDHFEDVDIARVRPGRSRSELRVDVLVSGSFSEEDRSLRIVVESNTEVCINLFQARTLQDRYYNVKLVVCVHEVSLSGHVGDLVARSPRNNEKFVTTGEVFLRQGHYVIVCHSTRFLPPSEKHKGILVVHSSRPLFCEQLMCPRQMYFDSLANLLLKEGNTHKKRAVSLSCKEMMMYENYNRQLTCFW